MKFTCTGTDYRISEDGVIHQVNPQPYTYDKAYYTNYDTEAYSRQSDLLQAIRLSFASCVHGRPIRSLVDSGFGNGAFMKFTRETVESVTGLDVTDAMVPHGCFRTERLFTVDVATYFDVIEHIHDLHFIQTIPAETVIISLPYCHYHTKGIEWFDSWKHRKKNEHVHHVDLNSLTRLMFENGWKRIAWGNMEDRVRKPVDDLQNILTAGFKRL